MRSAPLRRWVLLLVLTAACRRPPATLPPPPSSDEDASRGAATVHYVADPANPIKNLPNNVRMYSPVAIAEHPPEYPARALAAHAGAATVGLRIVVDKTGRVSSVGPSPVVATTPGPFESDFRAAAEAAARAWRFQSAWTATVVDGPDKDGDGKPDYKIATSTESIPVYLDVRIDFEIVDGKGTARVGGGAKP